MAGEVPVSCLREANILIAGTGNLLQKVVCPTLAIQSRADHVVSPANDRRIAENVGSNDFRMLWLENSCHVATLDNDKEQIVERSGYFISEVAGVSPAQIQNMALLSHQTTYGSQN